MRSARRSPSRSPIFFPRPANFLLPFGKEYSRIANVVLRGKLRSRSRAMDAREPCQAGNRAALSGMFHVPRGNRLRSFPRRTLFFGNPPICERFLNSGAFYENPPIFQPEQAVFLRNPPKSDLPKIPVWRHMFPVPRSHGASSMGCRERVRTQFRQVVFPAPEISRRRLASVHKNQVCKFPSKLLSDARQP